MYTLENDKVRITFDQKGNLVELINVITQHNYAGGYPVWRLFFQFGEKFDLEVSPADSCPDIIKLGDQLIIKYHQVIFHQKELNISVELAISIQDDDVKFGVKLQNSEKGIIIRDFHYPVIHDLKIEKGQSLITSDFGGMKFDNPQREILKYHTAYLAQDQNFIQKKVTYSGGYAATNNFLFADANQGLYFGLHSQNIEYTDHNFRLYKNAIDVSMARFPNCYNGQEWTQEGYIISPYSGSWHVAAKKYRMWAEQTWFKPHEVPKWVKEMTGWQRIIMKHQYGHIHYKFEQLAEIREDGQKGGIDTFFMFGWQKGGHDNNYPEYTPDDELGTVEDLKNGIEGFNLNYGGVILYSNGQLIDKESQYYKTDGKAVSIKDFRGNEITDGYYFQADGNFYHNFAARSFVRACAYCDQWESLLLSIVDTAFDFGCKAVFFDQLGIGGKVCWDPTHGHEVPALSTGLQRANQIKRLRDYARNKSQDMALGIELLFDITAVEADFIHTSTGATKTVNDWEELSEKPQSEFFVDWFRYIFPEIIISDREIRDGRDIERRVNHTLLKGLRNDVEIYRCRCSISEIPHYQKYLYLANKLRKKYSWLLLEGLYSDIEFFKSSNNEIDVRCFRNGNQLAIVATQSHLAKVSTKLKVVGYDYVESDGLNEFDVTLENDIFILSLSKHGLAVIILEKK